MSQTLDTRTLATNQTLTASYVIAAKTGADVTYPLYIELTGIDQVTLDYSYTTGVGESSNTIELKVELANPANGFPVDADWVQEPQMSVSGGTTTIVGNIYQSAGASAATTYSYKAYIPVSDKFMRVSVKESGVASNAGNVSIKATLRERITI
jgi:hypothetical protein